MKLPGYALACHAGLPKAHDAAFDRWSGLNLGWHPLGANEPHKLALDSRSCDLAPPRAGNNISLLRVSSPPGARPGSDGNERLCEAHFISAGFGRSADRTERREQLL